MPTLKSQNCKQPVQALGQINNVLILLAITLLMALATAAVAYFIDLVPAVDSGTQVASNTSLRAPVLD